LCITFITREDLWALRLSRIRISFLSVYFLVIYCINIYRYSSKTSFLVPPPIKNLIISTQLSLIVAQQVMFCYNFLFHTYAGFPIGEYEYFLGWDVQKPTSSRIKTKCSFDCMYFKYFLTNYTLLRIRWGEKLSLGTYVAILL